MSICIRPNCADPVLYTGLCSFHYTKLHIAGGTRMVPAANTRRRIQELHDAGLTYQRISQLSGVTVECLRRIRQGQYARIRRRTAHAIASVPFTPTPARSVPSIGLRRRARALARLGWPFKTLDAEAGWYPGRLSQLMYEDTTAVADHEAVCSLYDRLYLTPGPSTRARKWAEARGWPAPFDWDDNALDDPDAQPYNATRDHLTAAQRRARKAANDKARKRGIYRRVPVGPAREHAHQLQAMGWLLRDIAAASGVPVDTVRNVTARSRNGVIREVADAILALPLAPKTAREGTAA
ncbi:hypothetical protein OU415_02465 [Saccharopolyspora sp. WRP15-2]|uniref:Helix-turn-helix DNA binding domain protein n=1 Tax=Saccharopolyspora oryzae TaxID=2997343 RepID=A0ABT4URD7_9PSEU|nr:hypothetical protein [Saccharopolyspora oryzae]MDA3624281.1 hypothetical protein [Saccharopolyspora oryzae]